MIPLYKTFYVLLSSGVLYDAAFGGLSFTSCTYTKQIPEWPYEETNIKTCVTSCCEKDCCPTTDIEIWSWVAIGVSPVVIISAIVVFIICCKKKKNNTHSIAPPRPYVPPPRRFTDIYYDDFTSQPSTQASLNVMAQTSSNDIYSYDQNGDHVLSQLGCPTQIQLKNDDYAAHSSVQAALNSVAQTSIIDSSGHTYYIGQNNLH
ncbi:hypothetical protein ACJMK2_016549 [Sinanodonta woodiana]|uniref:Uncharacterized protein n=1 Tax=Sinanodonta woodiana TaxID=1069815 RepID=A0ABD3UTY0_SINWO